MGWRFCVTWFLEWQYAIINTVRWNFFNKWETLWGKLGLFSDPLMSSCFYRAQSFSTLLCFSLPTKPQVDTSLFKSVISFPEHMSVFFFFSSIPVWYDFSCFGDESRYLSSKMSSWHGIHVSLINIKIINIISLQLFYFIVNIVYFIVFYLRLFEVLLLFWKIKY